MKGSRPNLLIDFNMKTLILVSQNGMVRQILDIFSKQISDIRVGLYF